MLIGNNKRLSACRRTVPVSDATASIRVVTAAIAASANVPDGAAYAWSQARQRFFAIDANGADFKGAFSTLCEPPGPGEACLSCKVLLDMQAVVPAGLNVHCR